MLNNLRSLLTFILGWPLSIVALFFLGKTFASQLTHIKTSIFNLHWPLLLLGLLFFLFYYYMRSFIWYKLLRFSGFELDARESIFQWSFAQLRRYIPGNIWSLVGVSLHFRKKNVPNKDLATAFFIESEIVIIAAALVSLLGLPILLHALNLTYWQDLIIKGSAILTVLGVVIYCFSKKIQNIIPLPQKVIQYIFPRLPFNDLLLLISFMVLAFFCYGIGSYFVFSALTYLDPNQIFALIGYFVLSLMAGFLSLITPSGLGVREGMIVLGVSQFVGSSLAAFGAIFARIVLIIAELIFIGVSYLIHRLRKGRVDRIITFIQTHPYETIVGMLYTAFVGYFTWISFLRYDNYYTGRFDLGNMAQTVWNTLHGNIFEFTNPNGLNIVSRFSFHADVFLVLLAPFYAIWQDPRMLLVLQVLLTGGGVLFVYLLARDITKEKSLALVFSLLYLLNPSLERSVIYDFHAVTISTTFLLGAFYFVYKKRYWYFLFFAVLAALTKEQIWAVIALFGLYILFIQKNYKLGLAVFFTSISVLYALIWYVIPSFAGSQHFALSYYSNGQISDSPTSLIKFYLFSPAKAVELISDPTRINYLTKLLLPLGLLPLGAPLILIFTLPDLTINLLSTKSELYQIYYQYTAAITPFLFTAAIITMGYLLRKLPKVPTVIFILYLAVIGGYYSFLYGPLPGAKEPNLDMITKPFPEKKTIDKLLSTIPQEASVATSNSLGSHVANRRYLFTHPYGWNKADYVIFYLNDPNAYPSLKAHKEQIKKLKADKRYKIVFQNDTVIAFKKI